VIEYDQIWAKTYTIKFQSGSTWLDSTEFRLRSILHNTTKFWPESTWPNMATFLGRGLLGQISFGVDSTQFFDQGRLGWILLNFGHNRLKWIGQILGTSILLNTKKFHPRLTRPNTTKFRPWHTRLNSTKFWSEQTTLNTAKFWLGQLSPMRLNLGQRQLS